MKRTAALLVLVACSSAPPPRPAAPAAPPEPPPAQQLSQLADAFWAELMRRSPTWATDLGDRSRDAELDEISAEDMDAHLAVLGGIKGRLSRVDRAGLTPDEQVTADVMAVELGSRLASARACRTWLWTVDQLSGPQVELGRLPEIHTVTTEQNAADLTARYRKMAQFYAEMTANLRIGMQQGYLPARINVERVVQQLDDQLAVSPEKSAYSAVPLPESWPAEKKEKLRAEIVAAVREGVFVGLGSYRTFLKEELLPKARTEPGVVKGIPGGAACYAALIAEHTGTDLGAEEIHALGLSEVERIEAEMHAIARGANVKNARTYLARLEYRPDMHFRSKDKLLAYNEEILRRALAALPRAFGKLPRTPIEVKPLPEHQEKDAPAAYYFQAPADGSRPAYYRLNTYKPRERPLFSMPALAFHEAVPGHHLQIALQNENESLPMFRRQLGFTAFVEGWALYAESLASELGLYRNDDEQMGRLNYERWRAVRLVVDTGIHAKGWSRAQAIKYFQEHSANPRIEIENEVDRYILWPAQALAYKLGELTIKRLRADAQRALGDHFDLKAFHDEVLAAGATPMSTLERRMATWVATWQGPAGAAKAP